MIGRAERFLSAQADTFAGANVKENASACCARNERGGGLGRLEAGAVDLPFAFEIGAIAEGFLGADLCGAEGSVEVCAR
jgi:hypothetical protein